MLLILYFFVLHPHEFELVEEKKKLNYLMEPFDLRHVAEIARREDMIPLDTIRKVTSRVGFGAPGEEVEKEGGTCTSSQIYYVFPYSLNLDNMEKVCNVLFLQNLPGMISICMRPYMLTERDEAFLETRIKMCEKYSQLGIGISDNIESLDPFLKKQANALYDSCANTLLKLQDAAFLQKVQIVSSHPITQEVVNTVGITLTEHSGHPKLVFSEKSEQNFSGGYDCYLPKDEDQTNTALQNLKKMAFVKWIPSFADQEMFHLRYIFDVSQASAGFRLPIPIAAEFPGINTLQYHHKSAPSELPSKGIFIGEHSHLNKGRKVFVDKGDRRRHMYVVGKSGTGKSTLFLQMILQDINDGHGIGLIDPHGELIEDILPCIPEKRIKDVVYVNPQDLDYPVGLNLLEARTPYEKDFCVNYLIEVFDALYDLKSTGGPIFEQYMRNALQLLLNQPKDFAPTVLDVSRIFQDSEFRGDLLENGSNVFVHEFWKKEAEKAGGDAALANVAPYITSKLSRFVYNDTIRLIVGQGKSTIDFRKLMDSQKILLVDLRKGLLGDTNSHFLAMIIVGKLFTAALSRTGVKDKSKLKDFYFYVDEFQNVATPTFISILSEARKYRLALTITNQYISQLREDVRYGVFGNVGTVASFRVGYDDAKMLSREFGQVVSQNDFMGLPNWHAYLRLLVNGDVSAPFNIRTVLPERSPNPGVVNEIVAYSRKRYGRPREKVEIAALKSWGISRDKG